MSLSAIMGGSRLVTSVVNNSTLWSNGSSLANTANAVAALSGATTAGTLKTALSVNGRGQLNWLNAFTANATARTIRIKITRDGTVIYDKTTASISTIGQGPIAIGAGQGNSTPPVVAFQPILFNASLLVEIASSLTETDGFSVAWNYEVHS